MNRKWPSSPRPRPSSSEGGRSLADVIWRELPELAVDLIVSPDPLDRPAVLAMPSPPDDGATAELPLATPTPEAMPASRFCWAIRWLPCRLNT